MKKITLLIAILLTTVMANVSAAVLLTPAALLTPTVGTGTATTRGFTATWTAVANASSYNVTTYLDGTSTVVSTTNVTGATTATASVVNLVAATAYQFTVTAVGDGTTYTNSPESGKSASITTLTPVLSTPSAPSAATRITYTGFTANFSPVAGATTYDVRVYNASLVQVGSTVTVTPTGTTTLSATVNASGGLLATNTTYTYTVSACDGNNVTFNSPQSSQSASFTTNTSTTNFTLQYAASDATTLLADLKGGAADIYELTTSGGIYTFTSTIANNAVLIRSTTVRAAAGLAAKPIIKINSSNTSGTINIFNTVTPYLTIRFDGLEFDGVNLGNGGTGFTQPIAFYATTGASNLTLYVNNCNFHDFKNASGNGTIRWDGVPVTSTSNIIDIQGSIFNACSGRMIYSNPASGASNINLKNNTFSNNLLFSTRATIIYNNQSNPGTIVVDHCTFYNIITSGTDNIVRNSSGYGPMSFTNSIFVTVAQTLPTTNTTKDFCYLGGFATVPTGTNTFATVPTFTNAATLDFSLINKSLFTPTLDGSYYAGNTYNILPVPVASDATDLTSSGFTANWVAVTNAISYDVNVYDATLAQVGTTTNVLAGTLYAPITGLSTNTPYTYTVTAKGDNMNYFYNSNPSTPMAVSTSVATSINSLNGKCFITVSGKTIITYEIGNLEVFNLQGAKLIDAKITNSINSNLPKGLYLARFKSSDNQITIQKIILN